MSSPTEPTGGEEGSTDRTVKAAETQELATAHVQQTSPSPFRFLSLPPELRNEIYKIILVSTDPIDITRPEARL
ncbi:hypothetical protein CHU98_g9611 [Xylaria longipes]|nr:hypothetical protein CHU98_g9611 [Xylaria longipes]